MGIAAIDCLQEQQQQPRNSITADMLAIASQHQQTKPMSSGPSTVGTVSLTCELSESSISNTSFTRLFPKKVRFADDDNQVYKFRKAKNPGDVFISSAEQLKRGKDIKSEAKQWRSVGFELLLDLHKESVQERIERLGQLHSRAKEARGLEKEICSQLKERSLRQRKRTVRAVLEQQDALCNLPAKDHTEALAKASSDISHAARCHARVLALADQQFVRDHVTPPRRESLQKSASDSDMKAPISPRRGVSSTKSFSKAMKKIGRTVSKSVYGGRGNMKQPALPTIPRPEQQPAVEV